MQVQLLSSAASAEAAEVETPVPELAPQTLPTDAIAATVAPSRVGLETAKPLSSGSPDLPHGLAVPVQPPVASASAASSGERTVRAGAQAPVLPPAQDYLFSARLDSGPRPLDDIEPEYPAEGDLQEGKVALRLLISETGHVDNVAVASSYPAGLFDRAAIAAFANARFAPALLVGAPTKSQITIEVHFAPFNRGSRVSGRGY